jgi:hypothetical protein
LDPRHLHRRDFIHGDLDSFNLEAQDLFEDKGRRLIEVEFLTD